MSFKSTKCMQTKKAHSGWSRIGCRFPCLKIRNHVPESSVTVYLPPFLPVKAKPKVYSKCIVVA